MRKDWNIVTRICFNVTCVKNVCPFAHDNLTQSAYANNTPLQPLRVRKVPAAQLVATLSFALVHDTDVAFTTGVHSARRGGDDIEFTRLLNIAPM
jgi:hypothetical protein